MADGLRIDEVGTGSTAKGLGEALGEDFTDRGARSAEQVASSGVRPLGSCTASTRGKTRLGSRRGWKAATCF